jgi:chromosome segregation ATPase
MTAPHETRTDGAAATDTAAGTGNGSDGEQKPDIEELQANIEQTRQELGDTVEALTAKLDVKSRAKARVNDTKLRTKAQLNDVQARAKTQLTDVQARAKGLTTQARSRATTYDGKPQPAVLAGAGAVLASVLLATGLVVWRKRR